MKKKYNLYTYLNIIPGKMTFFFKFGTIISWKKSLHKMKDKTALSSDSFSRVTRIFGGDFFECCSSIAGSLDIPVLIC